MRQEFLFTDDLQLPLAMTRCLMVDEQDQERESEQCQNEHRDNIHTLKQDSWQIKRKLEGAQNDS
jgi:hypothetical protein